MLMVDVFDESAKSAGGSCYTRPRVCAYWRERDSAGMCTCLTNRMLPARRFRLVTMRHGPPFQ